MGILRMLIFGEDSMLTENLIREKYKGHKVWRVRSAKGSREYPRSNAEQGPRTAVPRTRHPTSPVLGGIPFIGQKLDIVKERKPQASYPRGETEPWVMHSSERECRSGMWRMKRNASQESWESAPCLGLPFSSTEVYYTKEHNKP